MATSDHWRCVPDSLDIRDSPVRLSPFSGRELEVFTVQHVPSNLVQILYVLFPTIIVGEEVRVDIACFSAEIPARIVRVHSANVLAHVQHFLGLLKEFIEKLLDFTVFRTTHSRF